LTKKLILFLAIAKAVAEWRAKKDSGELDLDKNQEENIYLTRQIKVHKLNSSRSSAILHINFLVLE